MGLIYLALPFTVALVGSRQHQLPRKVENRRN